MEKIKVKPTQTTGFTLIELVIVIAVVAIMAAAGLPPLLQWRESLRYKEVSKGLVAALRTARSTAITTNRQVELEFVGNTYRTRTGNRAIASTAWSNTTWVALPTGVGLSAPNSRVIANPNGTLFFTSVSEATAVFSSVSTTMAVSVQNISVTPAVSRYNVGLSQTGRIAATKYN